MICAVNGLESEIHIYPQNVLLAETANGILLKISLKNNT